MVIYFSVKTCWCVWIKTHAPAHGWSGKQLNSIQTVCIWVRFLVAHGAICSTRMLVLDAWILPNKLEYFPFSVFYRWLVEGIFVMFYRESLSKLDSIFFLLWKIKFKSALFSFMFLQMYPTKCAWVAEDQTHFPFYHEIFFYIKPMVGKWNFQLEFNISEFF